MSINVWKKVVCEAAKAYDYFEDIALDQTDTRITDYITALECLCTAYETEQHKENKTNE